jgi:hypothetical protein
VVFFTHSFSQYPLVSFTFSSLSCYVFFLTTCPVLCRVLLYGSLLVLTLPVLPFCGLLVYIGLLVAPYPVPCFIYSYYTTCLCPCVAYSFTLKMEAAVFSEILVPICQTTLYHIPEDCNLWVSLSWEPQIFTWWQKFAIVCVVQLYYLVLYLG